jgi:transcriptional regulator with XRE-family HTH domain
VADNPEFGERLKRARAEFERRRGYERLSNRELGEQVAERMGREEPYSSQAVSRWFAGTEPDSLEVFVALGRVLGVAPGWLAFGDDYLAEGAAVLDANQPLKGAVPLREATPEGLEAERQRQRRRNG